jgi:hypothetical protein
MPVLARWNLSGVVGAAIVAAPEDGCSPGNTVAGRKGSLFREERKLISCRTLKGSGGEIWPIPGDPCLADGDIEQ